MSLVTPSGLQHKLRAVAALSCLHLKYSPICLQCCSLLRVRSGQCAELVCCLLQSEAVSGAPPSDRDDDAVASYELRDLPGRRLRRWPRGARRGARAPLYMWNMLETYRWPWDD
jgi:hypothetical protein